jgi:endonuclease-3
VRDSSKILRCLKAEYSDAPKTALKYGSVFQLLVATVLSARCTDEQVNKTTPELFRRFPDAGALSHADIE